ncbi:MAG: hypothetical protein M3Z66_21690 [Chloroflexota bacterium]|nr:hypothetical protein [Chloroflexota bacterium]
MSIEDSTIGRSLGGRQKVITPDHLHAFHRSLHAVATESFLEVHGSTIDDLMERSGDTYLWHREPGAAYAESDILRSRIDAAGINPQARLAHGALGLLYALETAYLQSGDTPIRGLSDLRFVAPVFEGARLRSHVEEVIAGVAAFEVTSEQTDLSPAEPSLAITGQVLYGSISDTYDAARFANLGEQQLFSLEEAIGILSALIGLWVQGEGGRVLYMGQELVIGGLVEVWDRIEADGAIVASQPGKRAGRRTTTRVTVSADRQGAHLPIANGESILLYLEHQAAR